VMINCVNDGIGLNEGGHYSRFCLSADLRESQLIRDILHSVLVLGNFLNAVSFKEIAPATLRVILLRLLRTCENGTLNDTKHVWCRL